MSIVKISVLFRGIAFAIDTVISTVISMIISRLIFGDATFQYLKITIIIGFLLLMIRDVFGKSVGKYILGLNIVDCESNKKSNLFRRILKNITTPLTVVEIPIALLGKNHRRLGDMLAKTETKVDDNSSALLLFNRIIKNK